MEAFKIIRMKIKFFVNQGGKQTQIPIDELQVLSTGQIITDGSDEFGDYSIRGQFKRNGEVSFEKNYEGMQKLIYYGKLVPIKKEYQNYIKFEIRGNYIVDDLEENFTIKIRAKVFTGIYLGDFDCPSIYFLKFQNFNNEDSKIIDGAFGVGLDSGGAYLWSGEFNDADFTNPDYYKKVTLTKHYVEQDKSVSYQGKICLEEGFESFSADKTDKIGKSFMLKRPSKSNKDLRRYFFGPKI